MRSEIEIFWPTVPSITDFATAWPDIPPEPEDIVLFNKAYMASAGLSQLPVVFCPARFLRDLDPAELRPAASAQLGERQKKELMKSAAFFEQAPFQLQRTGLFLRELVGCDGTPRGQPADWPFIFGAGLVHEEGDVEHPVLLPPIEEPPDPGLLAGLTTAEVRVVLRRKATKPRTTMPSVPGSSAGRPKQDTEPMAPTDSGVERAHDESTTSAAVKKRPAAGRPPVDAIHDPARPLGCSKCRRSVRGCAVCKRRAGIIIG